MAESSESTTKQVRQRRAESPKPPGSSKTQDDAAKGSKGDEVKTRSIDFTKVPVQCNGLALGLFGCAGVVLNFQVVVFGPAASASASVAWWLASAIALLALLNQALYVAKLVSAPKKTWQEDFCSVAACGGQVQALTTANGSVLIARLISSWPGLKAAFASLAWGGVACAVVMQLLAMARFYQMVRRESCSRSVLFFAPSVSIATFGVTGGPVGMPGEFIALSCWLGVAVMLLLLPVVAHRCVTNPEQSNNPSIGLLMAPGAYSALAWHAASRTSPAAAAWLGHKMVGDVLFCISVMGLGATVYCSLKRKQALRSAWFSSPWAAYGFPAASNAQVALHQAMARPNIVFTSFAVLVCAVAIPLILTINIKHIMHLAGVFELRSNRVATAKPVGARTAESVTSKKTS
jgi:hypothetical protein